MRPLLLLLCLLVQTCLMLTRIPKEEQTRLVLDAQSTCYNITIDYFRQLNFTDNRTDECSPTFDRIACWPASPSHSTVSISCPNYIDQFLVTENATKNCLDGVWDRWTNYTACIAREKTSLIEEHQFNLKLIYSFGYSLSFITLILAFFILIGLRNLHSNKNVMHLNLFASFILRGLFTLLKDILFVKDLGLRRDFVTDSSGQLLFNLNVADSHWQCKFLTILFRFGICANHFWIFVEALYLYCFISIYIWSDRHPIWQFFIIGWGCPLLVILCWVTVRAVHDDTFCWNVVQSTPKYEWIIRGPIVTTIVLNLCLFVLISRIVYKKLHDHVHSADYTQNKRFIRSTMILIPLFGLHYTILVWVPDDISPTFELFCLYFGLLFNSFQGFLVALLFCFLNNEVNNELGRIWNRIKSRRHTDVRGDFSLSLTRVRLWSRSDLSATCSAGRTSRQHLTSRTSDGSPHDGCAASRYLMPPDSLMLTSIPDLLDIDDDRHPFESPPPPARPRP